MSTDNLAFLELCYSPHAGWKTSKCCLQSLFYIWQKLLIGIQPNMTWLCCCLSHCNKVTPEWKSFHLKCSHYCVNIRIFSLKKNISHRFQIWLNVRVWGHWSPVWLNPHPEEANLLSGCLVGSSIMKGARLFKHTCAHILDRLGICINPYTQESCSNHGHANLGLNRMIFLNGLAWHLRCESGMDYWG